MLKTEDDTYRTLIRSPFHEVLDAHRSLNLCTSEQLEAILKDHKWTKKEYNDAMNKYYSDMVGRPVEITLGMTLSM